jgi:hypothetical protein
MVVCCAFLEACCRWWIIFSLAFESASQTKTIEVTQTSEVVMELLRFPQFVESFAERQATLVRAVEAIRAVNSRTSRVPTICFFVQLPTEPRLGVVRKLLENTRKDLDAVAKSLKLQSMLLLGLRFLAADSSDLAKSMKLSSAMVKADVLVLQLDDPACLEGLRSDAFDYLGPHQVLLVDVDACVVAASSGGRGDKGRSESTDPRAFVLPPKSLPKGRVGLVCSYPRWLEATSSYDDITNARRRFSGVQKYLVERLRAPLLATFNGGIDANSDASVLLAVRQLQDVYSLLSTLCGAATASGTSRSMYAEAVGFVTKCFGNSCAAAAGRWLRSLPLISESSEGKAGGKRRRKRGREDDADEIGLSLIEDVPQVPH